MPKPKTHRGMGTAVLRWLGNAQKWASQGGPGGPAALPPPERGRRRGPPQANQGQAVTHPSTLCLRRIQMQRFPPSHPLPAEPTERGHRPRGAGRLRPSSDPPGAQPERVWALGSDRCRQELGAGQVCARILDSHVRLEGGSEVRPCSPTRRPGSCGWTGPSRPKSSNAGWSAVGAPSTPGLSGARTVRNLFLDDLGRERSKGGDDYAMGVLSEIITARYRAGKAI